MIRCEFCGLLIENEERDKHYKITLGDVVLGKFHGRKNIYYHKECLEVLNKLKKEILSELY